MREGQIGSESVIEGQRGSKIVRWSERVRDGQRGSKRVREAREPHVPDPSSRHSL